VQAPVANVEINAVEMKIMIDTGVYSGYIGWNSIPHNQPTSLEEEMSLVFSYMACTFNWKL